MFQLLEVVAFDRFLRRKKRCFFDIFPRQIEGCAFGVLGQTVSPERISLAGEGLLEA